LTTTTLHKQTRISAIWQTAWRV